MTKKLFAAWALAVLLLFSLAGHAAAHENTHAQHGQRHRIERTMPVDPEATITLCVAAGTLTVRGWDKNEIHVRSLDAARIDFRRIDTVKDASRPANRVDVMVFDRTSAASPRHDCRAIASVEMEVPVGATVQVQTRDGDITIAGVAGAYAGSQHGDIEIERVTKLVEAGSLGGSLFLKNSSGRVNLSSVGGVIEVTNVQPTNDEDTFEVGTVSGDIQIDRVSNPKVNVKTVNGTITMTGPLAKSGSYVYSNMTGDLVLAMPQNASFQLRATISEKRDIISDFALKYLSEAPPAPPARPGKPAAETAPKPPDKKAQPLPRTGPIVSPVRVVRPSASTPYVLRRVTAICGTGDATISIASFGGAVRLKKI